MGTAASIDKKVSKLQSIEQLGKSKYYFNEIEEYKTAVEGAIQRNCLDELELLIPAGPARRILPLHTGAIFGALEVLELLISAGFSCYSKNGEGSTPLHCAAMNRSQESFLCATFLSLQGMDAINMKDSRGFMPIHVAAERNNVTVLRALVDQGARLDALNGSGKTAKQIAIQLNKKDVLRVLNELELHLAAAKTSITSRDRGNKAKKVSKERMMMVWEAFFENCMKRFGNNEFSDLYGGTDVDDECEDDGDGDDLSMNSFYTTRRTAMSRATKPVAASAAMVTPTKTTTPAVVSSRKTKVTGASARSSSLASTFSTSSSTSSSTPSAAYSDWTSPVRGVSMGKGPVSPVLDFNEDFDLSVQDMEWFQWLLCYSAPTDEWEEIDGSSRYFVVHTRGRETCRWLTDHLLQLGRGDLLEAGEGSRSHAVDDLPYSLPSAVSEGWMPYYEESSNQVKWMCLHSGRVEYYLPLGSKHESYFECLELVPYVEGEGAQESKLWISCSQRCSWEWVTVESADKFTQPDPSDDDYYDYAHALRARTTGKADHKSLASASDKSRDRSSKGSMHHHGKSASSSAIQDKGWSRTLSGGTAISGNNCYYYNRIVGCSSWTPPPGMLEYWGGEASGGWRLCMSSASSWQLYWWHEESGESAWVEEA